MFFLFIFYYNGFKHKKLLVVVAALIIEQAILQTKTDRKICRYYSTVKSVLNIIYLIIQGVT